jgi:purine-nucleoside phosphorylase
VLGSGLGSLADDLENPVAIPFEDMPGWPVATAPGHAGRLLLGRLAGVPVAMLQGRLHVYEGNDPGLVIQPVLLFRLLGARLVVMTNAAGGVNPDFGPGTLMVIADHLNLTGRTPLLGPNADELGPRFADMTDVWAPRLRERLRAAATSEGVAMAEGVYAGLLGPTYETPAEVRMLRTVGAMRRDVHGARGDRGALGGLEVCGISLVTNAGARLRGQPLTHAACSRPREAGRGSRGSRPVRSCRRGRGGDQRLTAGARAGLSAGIRRSPADHAPAGRVARRAIEQTPRTSTRRRHRRTAGRGVVA